MQQETLRIAIEKFDPDVRQELLAKVEKTSRYCVTRSQSLGVVNDFAPRVHPAFGSPSQVVLLRARSAG